MENYDRDILKALKGATRDAPTDVADILMWVDARQRLLLTHEELEGGLRRLITAGKAAEATPLHFFPTPVHSEVRAFSGVTAAQHRDAVRTYKQRLKQSEDLPEEADPGRPLLVVRWSARNAKDITDEDEDSVEELADRLEPLLPPVAQAEIIGFERGGDDIDILVWGVGGTDEEVDKIYHAMVGAFREFGCPRGSAIIRYYDGGESELETDVQ